jgi:hypothetical protein
MKNSTVYLIVGLGAAAALYYLYSKGYLSMSSQPAQVGGLTVGSPQTGSSASNGINQGSGGTTAPTGGSGPTYTGGTSTPSGGANGGGLAQNVGNGGGTGSTNIMPQGFTNAQLGLIGGNTAPVGLVGAAGTQSIANAATAYNTAVVVNAITGSRTNPRGVYFAGLSASGGSQ